LLDKTQRLSQTLFTGVARRPASGPAIANAQF
jgi:hypothetical protein